ncbi:MAG: hypothetical protein KGI97_04660 [Alphaproteobacteria bacterium]|nr:hypothetical protein [Alphaproteobacteria bacterium]
MRFALSFLLAFVFAVPAARAQSVADNLPPVVVQAPAAQASASAPASDAAAATAAPAASSAPAALPAAASVAVPTMTGPYTVANVPADVTADTAAHARDQALTQAEHTAFAKICASVGAPSGMAAISDDAVAALVQSFEVQSEQLSPVRYIGVFTIQFDPAALQQALGKYAAALANVGGAAQAGAAETNGGTNMAPPGNYAHLTVTVATPSLAAWTQTKRRVELAPQVARVDVLALGRGESHIDLAYTGDIDGLQQGLAAEGLALQQGPDGAWRLTDNGIAGGQQ